MRNLIEGCPDLLSKVQQFYASSLEFSVKLKTGQRLRYLARSSGGGRGFSGDCVILDEAFQLGPTEMGALLPTLSSRPNPQVWYTSSAPMSTSQQLHAVRRRALKGTDESLAYLEWSAPDDADPRDPASWAMANPAMGIRITTDYILKELDALPESEFGRERLGIPDPEPRPPGESIIPMSAWLAAADEHSEIVGRMALSADINPARTWGSLAVAGLRPDDDWHIEVVEHREGTSWMVDRILELLGRHEITVVTIDPTGPAGSLIAPLTEAGVTVDKVNARGHAQSCGLLYDMATAADPDGTPRPTVRHISQPELSNALLAADRRDLGDAWAWRRSDGNTDISPLVAATLALGAAIGMAAVEEAPVFAY